MAAPMGNKYAVGNKGGRPAFFNSADELQLKIEAYFTNPPDKREIVFESGTIKVSVFSICGLAYYLGFESRQSFYAYEQKEEFNYIIKRARLRIEQMYEQNLQMNNVSGSIFALKNMGWQDKVESEHTGEIQINVVYRNKPNSNAT